MVQKFQIKYILCNYCNFCEFLNIYVMYINILCLVRLTYIEQTLNENEINRVNEDAI